MPASASRPLDSPASRPSTRGHRCTTCGYGVSVSPPPAECPMCRAAAWEPGPWSPFGVAPQQPLGERWPLDAA